MSRRLQATTGRSGEALAARTEAENAAREGATIAREVIPRAEAALSSVEGAWLSSKANLLEVLEARRSLLQSRVEERRAAAMQKTALEMLRTILPNPESTLSSMP